MAGIRIRHDTLKGVTLVVLHPKRRYREPYLCPVCKITHKKKAFHIKLDGEGCAIVSPQVLNRLKECGMPKLTIENEVLNPPKQVVGIGSIQGRFEIVEHESTGNKLLILTRKLFGPKVKPYG